MQYVAIIRTPEHYFLLVDAVVEKDAAHVASFPTASDGVAYFEQMYRATMLRGYEGQRSAALFWLHFQPSIIAISDAQALLSLIPTMPFHVAAFQSDSGLMHGIILDAARSAPLFVNGTLPALISYKEIRHSGYNVLEST